MGTVYLAHDTELDRNIALKIPKFQPAEGLQFRERFRREARLAAKLDDPAICRIHDIGEYQGQPYLTMAYVEGKTLAEVLASGKPLEPRNWRKLPRLARVEIGVARCVQLEQQALRQF
jgi:serine/threonine protein kinase